MQNRVGALVSTGVIFLYTIKLSRGFPGGSVVKNPPASARDTRDAGSILGSHGGGNGNPLQYSCPENPMDRGSWWATVHRVTELDTTEGSLAWHGKVKLI